MIQLGNGKKVLLRTPSGECTVIHRLIRVSITSSVRHKEVYRPTDAGAFYKWRGGVQCFHEWLEL